MYVRTLTSYPPGPPSTPGGGPRDQYWRPLDQSHPGTARYPRHAPAAACVSAGPLRITSPCVLVLLNLRPPAYPLSPSPCADGLKRCSHIRGARELRPSRLRGSRSFKLPYFLLRVYHSSNSIARSFLISHRVTRYPSPSPSARTLRLSKYSTKRKNDNS